MSSIATARELLEVATGRRRPEAQDRARLARELSAQGLAVLALDQPAVAADARLSRALRDERVRLSALQLLRHRVLDELRSVAGDAPIVALKGAAFALQLYPTPEHRPMSDVDLLLHPADRETVATALLVRGFVNAGPVDAGHRERALAKGPVRIELHHTLAVDARFRLDTDALLSRARPLHGLDGFLALDLPDALVYHVVHQAMHHYTLPLIGWVDLARALAQIDGSARWEELLARAFEAGAVRALEVALAVVKSLDLFSPKCVPSPLRPRLASRSLASLALPADRPAPDRHEERGVVARAALKFGLADDLSAAARTARRLGRIRGGHLASTADRLLSRALALTTRPAASRS